MPSPGEFAAHLRDERAKRRRRRWILGIGGGVLVVVITVLVWLFLFSSVLNARAVTVEGVKLLEKQQVIEVAQVPMGEPIAVIQTGQVADRVGALSEVKNAFVTREFPNTIHIEVVERRPVFQLRDGGSFDLVDDDAHVVRSGQGRVEGLPEASAPKRDARMMRDIATVVDSLSPQVHDSVALVELKTVDRIEIHLASGRTVIWGSADESALKAQVLDPLLTVDAKIYDVSAPNHPTTR